MYPYIFESVCNRKSGGNRDLRQLYLNGCHLDVTQLALVRLQGVVAARELQ